MTAKKRPRFLPRHVSRFRDRHGKLRYRYRRAGHPGGYFKAELGTDEFRSEYRDFEAQPVVDTGLERRAVPGSVDDLVTRYVAVPDRLGPSTTTQNKVRAIVDKFRDEHGHRFVADFRFDHIDAIIAKKRARSVAANGRPVGGIEAARKLRKELVRLFDHAEKIGMRPDGSNPVRKAEKVRVAAGARSTGFHTWAEEEISQYRASHKLGTNARLAMELMLWTGQRRVDAIRMGPDDIRAGKIALVQTKTGKGLRLTIAPQLLEAIKAIPARAGAAAFLLNHLGRPFSNAGFGNKMREWCDEAGLPQCTAHGLRKAMMRRMAELNLANRTLKSVSGHSQDNEVSVYTEAANQARLADDAIALVAQWETDSLANPDCLTGDEPA
ncbi:MAG: tyrosine-type recombinase/integrase [Candidatus Sphingomonas colombiensis]|nr:tyrosine-type recombinase/integrase [Sphingomonas sp.]WEK42929.1 MAG: tyrosine-type recombinase/integrase [Sphingomonas sp.]